MREPGRPFTIAVFGINGPISASPRNYIWMRTATPRPLRARARARGRGRGARGRHGTRRARRGSWAPMRRSSAWPAASSSPRGRCGRRRRRCSSPRPTPMRSTAGRPTARSDVFRSKSGYTGVDIGRYHQPGSNGLTFDPDGPADALPARQPAHPARRAAWQRHRAGGLVRGPAAEQPERPRVPLRRHALLHRPAVRPAGGLRRPGQGAAVQRRVRGPSGRRDLRSSRTSSKARTGWRSRPTSATSTSATGTTTTRS